MAFRFIIVELTQTHNIASLPCAHVTLICIAPSLQDSLLLACSEDSDQSYEQA